MFHIWRKKQMNRKTFKDIVKESVSFEGKKNNHACECKMSYHLLKIMKSNWLLNKYQ